ncbi:hypothetical protein [Limnoglobus roseus]|uniref:Uncharacterized protein n=1 Tax=Limnoglobus roseus TaxID=2598579 RepID=A0A5C1A4Q7_9BACT|nr:hypothetical protein [Limnoglobus roseus]QEL13313.1 hypothetical protein PX52LOC_00167 [Limnoglobus roseus]
MRRRTVLVLGGLMVTTGCHSLGDSRLAQRIAALPGWPKNQVPPLAPTTYSQYHHDGWQWGSVSRVLVLPPLNESPYTRANTEFHAALTSELQRLGRFEVVAAPPDDCARLAATVHRDGSFDEATMLELARITRADVVVHAAITQYSPYPRPRMGVVVQVVHPGLAKVVASVDGLWDTTDAGIAEQVRTFYRQRPKPLPPRVRNYQIANDDVFAEELALDSPALFQRWVAHVISETLLGEEAASGVANRQAPAPAPVAGGSTSSACSTCPPAPVAPRRTSIFPLKQ